MNLEVMEKISQTYADLAIKKGRLKDLRAQVREEMERLPGYDGAKVEQKAAADKMKLLKIEALTRLNCESEIEQATEEVKATQEFLDDIVATAVATGQITNRQEIKHGDTVIVPTIKVKISLKQMALDI